MTTHCASWPAGPLAGGRDDVSAIAGITRIHVEDYKVWLTTQPGVNGANLAKNTQRRRLPRSGSSLSASSNGLGGCPATQPDLPRGYPASDRSAAQVLKRPRRGKADEGGSSALVPALSTGRRNARPHRDARQRTLRPQRRRRHLDRRRLLAANPGRQAPQRPVDSAAPRPCRALGRLDGTEQRVHPGPKAPHGRRALTDARRTVHHIVATTAKKAGIGTSTPTSSATHSPPRRSIGVCDSKPLRHCSVTVPWR